MNKLILASALFGLTGGSVFATTTYSLTTNSSQTVNSFDGEDISPYTGGLSNETGSVNLYCDDLNDTFSFGQGWTVYETAVNSSATTLDADTRFGGDLPSNSYNTPNGTQLYEEVAWLFGQETFNPSLTKSDQIQEAVWLLTSPTGTDSKTAAGSSVIAAWISDAQTYYGDSVAATPTQFVAQNYSQWDVITDTNAADKGSAGGGKQEFLAYVGTPGAGGVIGTGGAAKAPEPASFFLFGSGLFAVGFLGRRKLSKQ